MKLLVVEPIEANTVSNESVSVEKVSFPFVLKAIFDSVQLLANIRTIIADESKNIYFM
jgi:hypothetical protein